MEVPRPSKMSRLNMDLLWFLHLKFGVNDNVSIIFNTFHIVEVECIFVCWVLWNEWAVVVALEIFASAIGSLKWETLTPIFILDWAHYWILCRKVDWLFLLTRCNTLLWTFDFLEVVKIYFFLRDFLTLNFTKLLRLFLDRFIFSEVVLCLS